tara:strand:- start:247 stop:801 length:555 start_codon:yes stop_codon:yes gene_type:complete
MSEDLNSYMIKTADGDKDSFRFIAKTLGYKMHATAIKILGSSHFEEAEDIVQISLIKLWQTAPRWKKKGSVEGYIYKIVFSCCMDFLRKYKSAEEFKENYFNPSNLHNYHSANELRKMLLSKIQKLPKDQQEAILLHYFSGYKQKEVSNLLKKSDKATESLIIRARKKLKSILPKDILEELLHV